MSGNDALTPLTLWDAHQVLSAVEPAKDASPEVWLSYYRRSARVYADVAEVDRGHYHEAMAWSNRERAKAVELQEQLDNRPSKKAAPAKSARSEPESPN